MTCLPDAAIETGHRAPATIGIQPHPDHPGAWRLHAELLVPQDRQTVFAFFSDAFQLETITPPWLQFEVLTPAPIDMQAGALIDYRLRLRGVPLRWQSRIAVWDPPHCFVDEQTRGPYRMWRHEHRFEETAGGTRVLDRVEYSVPGGALVHRLIVRPDIARIFAWRHTRLQQIFGQARACIDREPFL